MLNGYHTLNAPLAAAGLPVDGSWVGGREGVSVFVVGEFVGALEFVTKIVGAVVGTFVGH